MFRALSIIAASSLLLAACSADDAETAVEAVAEPTAAMQETIEEVVADAGLCLDA